MGFEHRIGLSDLTVFAREVGSLCCSKETLMGVPLLHLLQSLLGYRLFSLSNYSGSRFIDLKAIGRNAEDAKHFYIESFQKTDPFAAHIGKINKMEPETLFLQSSKVFGNDYAGSNYYRFINSFGFSWALALPIGQSDFCGEEIRQLCFISSLIRTLHKVQGDASPSGDAGMADVCRLTKREAEVAKLLAEGMGYQEIANRTFISINTVRTHVKSVYRKLGIDNRLDLYRILSLAE